MPKLDRAVRKQIRSHLELLDSLDLSSETPESIRQKLDQFSDLLEEKGVSPHSSYYDRLDELTSKAEKHSGVSSQTNSQGKREYVGMSRGARIKIKILESNTILSRQYFKQFKVSWSFNPEGRIEFVASLSYESNKRNRLITVNDFKTLPKDWTSAEAECEELPPYVLEINPGFARQSPRQQYSSLLRFGHGDARNLMTNLETADIKDAYKLNPNQRQLVEIVDDPSALHIIANAGAIIPTLSDFEDSSFSITYTKNNRN